MQEPGDAALPRGWVPLGEYRWLVAVLTALTLPSALFFWLFGWHTIQLAVFVDPDASLFIRIASGVGILLVVFVIFLLVQGRRAPRPFVNFDTDELRFGGRTVPITDLVWAQLIVVEGRKRRTVTLTFGTASKIEARFRLVGTGGRTLDAGTARLVAAVLGRSSIAMPVDRYDPKGRFAKTNFPTHLTRDEAIGVVVAPPVRGTQLPIPSMR